MHDMKNKKVFIDWTGVKMEKFNNKTYEALAKDLINDAFYLEQRSRRGTIATIRQYSEIIVRRVLDLPCNEFVTIGNKNILKELEKRSNNNPILLDSLKRICAMGNKSTHTQEIAEITEEDLKEGLERLKEYDVIFVDTAGRLHNKKYLMDELNKIIERYKDDPYNFETFCAHLYYLMGIDAECTSCSNDGGYDIVLNFKNGEKGIVECKCYNNKKIGRPYIQKLVGANQIVGAEHLIYITTSDYSEAAIKYAKETDVELINGIQLLDMINKYIKPHNIIVTVNREEWSLCDEDLKEYIPRDIYIKL